MRRTVSFGSRSINIIFFIYTIFHTPTAFAQQQTPSSISPSNTSERAPINLSRRPLRVEAGVFSNSRQSAGSTLRVDWQGLYYLTHTRAEELTSDVSGVGIALAPQVLLRLDATAETLSANREVLLGGFQLMRFHSQGGNIVLPESPAVRRLNNLANETEEVAREIRSLVSDISSSYLTMSNASFALARHIDPQNERTSAISHISQMIIETIRRKATWHMNDRVEVCSARYRLELDRGRSQAPTYLQFTPEQAALCAQRLAEREGLIEDLRDTSARLAEHQTRSQRLQQRLRTLEEQHRTQRSVVNNELSPGHIIHRTAGIPSEANWISAPTRAWSFAMGDVLFTHRFNSWTALNSTGALINGATISGQVGARFSSLQMEFCATIMPLSVVLGSVRVGPQQTVSAFQFAANACAIAHLGRLGRLRNQTSFDYLVFESEVLETGHRRLRDSSVLRVANFLGFERIGGTPLGVGYRYEYENSRSPGGLRNDVHTHFGVVDANF